MSRNITVGAAQFGPVSSSETRHDTVRRLIALMREAHDRGCDLVVFTEAALVPFFPHWHMTDEEQIDAYFEREMPGPETQPLFDEAARLGIGFHLGYAELDLQGGRKRRFNTAVLVDKSATIIGKYRKIHLPGFAEYQPGHSYQNLEKYYFDPGDLGFKTWRCFGGVIGMCICYDRRWPETYRVLSLQGAEMILLGYNTPDHPADKPGGNHLGNFHNLLTMQAGALQNATFVVGVAKAGVEEGVSQIGQSCIIAPTGEIVAQASTLEDELIVSRCDLDLAQRERERIDYTNRRVAEYELITQRMEAIAPEEA